MREYTYDDNGNRLAVLDGSGVVIESGTHDAQDRLLAYGDSTYEYTANGELLSKTTGGTEQTDYDYDVNGNLRSVMLPDGTVVEYQIDPAGRRVGRVVDGVAENRWLWSSRLGMAAELDEGGAVTARYVHATGINVPDYIDESGSILRIITDHLGSPRLVVNTTTGHVVGRIDYDEWGNVTRDDSPGTIPFGFAGGLYDTETGLVRFGYRDYDAEVGRWTAKDPIGFGGGDTNLYAYVGNEPVRRVDPSGLQAMPPIPGNPGYVPPTTLPTTPAESPREWRIRQCTDNPGLAASLGIDCNDPGLLEPPGDEVPELPAACLMSCVFGPPEPTNPEYLPGECSASPACGSMSFDEIKYECVVRDLLGE